MAEKRRVVVTGMGALTPIGLSVDEFWKNLLAGKSGSANVTYFDTSRLDTKFACELKGFDVQNYLDKKSARRMDPFAQYAMVTADMAVQDSGLNPEQMSIEDKERTGVVFGSGMGGMQTYYEQSIVLHKEGPKRVSPFFVPMIIPDIASGLISIKYGFKGPNYCIVSACATGNNNMIDSFRLIAEDSADIMITGGSEAS